MGAPDTPPARARRRNAGATSAPGATRSAGTGSTETVPTDAGSVIGSRPKRKGNQGSSLMSTRVWSRVRARADQPRFTGHCLSRARSEGTAAVEHRVAPQGAAGRRSDGQTGGRGEGQLLLEAAVRYLTLRL